MRELTKEEQEKREALKRKKPLVYEKIINISKRLENNIPTPVVDIAYDYFCDLSCAHCLTSSISSKKNKLTTEKLYEFTTEADKLGLCQLCLSGGEPLLFENFDEIVQAMQPDKFHIKLSTHGRHLTREMAERLARLGIDKVSMSMDSFHGIPTNFADKDKYPKNIQALLYLKEFGLDPVIATVVSKQNCREDFLINLIKFAQIHDLRIDCFLAKPLGQWKKKYEIMIDNDDYEYLKKLHEEYPPFYIDTFPSYGIQRTCGAVKTTLHLTPYGDLCPCAFIHVSLGNIFEESLEEIMERSMKIKYFNKPSPICLSGRNKAFMEKISVNSADGTFPPTWKDVFIDDFVK